MPITLATCEAQIRRTMIQGQPSQKVRKTPLSTKKIKCSKVHLWSQLHRRPKIGRSQSEANQGKSPETLPEK
jgi:hypothetical protein